VVGLPVPDTATVAMEWTPEWRHLISQARGRGYYRPTGDPVNRWLGQRQTPGREAPNSTARTGVRAPPWADTLTPVMLTRLM
jgi:hypothetical protein